MREKIILVIMSVFAVKASAQLTSTNINFNNYVSATDNDLKNNFASTASYNLFQNGSEYYVSTPLQGMPLQGLKLCNRYQGVDNETMTISIDYKLDLFPTPAPLSNGVGIFLRNSADNNLVMSTRIAPQRLYIEGLSNPSSTDGAFLAGNSYTNGNWYRLTLTITKTAVNKYSLTSKIYNLGTAGNTPISLVSTYTVEGNSYQFTPTNSVYVEILGGRWGDVTYLDNLSVFGFKNGNSCQTLSTAETSNKKQIKIYPNPTSKDVNFNFNTKKVEIYNLTGQLLESYENPAEKINIEHLPKGNYLLKFYTTDNNISQQIIKN
ncbi:hypothetical protein M2347_003088 [Chryseobacterium sp. H1D6B]|uniref:T9SS type A sorting domain-containing protein n=1 Tax=Chryseobacterium sp. H1D6B TaxID=2940588 RepID=UPI0015C6E533|nr:T9SS type A sorting domain-containing protein [Chryseobacterium sp. H1D6B]MDH6253361.1 hypothetical protein [Chryseobacterium sp. H1D6B]